MLGVEGYAHLHFDTWACNGQIVLIVPRYRKPDSTEANGPRDVPPHEAAEMVAKALGPFALDWRRVEDGLPNNDLTVLVAVSGEQRALRATYLIGLGWCEVDGRVYAWAPLPEIPDPKSLIGFPPRPPGP